MLKRIIQFNLWIAAFMMLSFTVSAQSADAGKTLFKNYCASCHAKNMKSDATGPALAGVSERWESEEELYAWIRNSQALINAGNPRAKELWAAWKPTVMTAFPDLKDEEIASLLLYINGVADGSYGPKKAIVDPAGGNAGAEENGLNAFLLPGLLLVLGAIAVFLFNITQNLRAAEAEKKGLSYERKSIGEALSSKPVVGFVLFAAVIFAGYTTVTRAVDLGRQQGYQPDQPIKFSHATHAGVNKIDCQYCHDGARRSKHSNIPANNTCMNCHAAIKVGSKYGTGEITKIYAANGFDPNTGKYIEGVEDMSNDDLKPIYTKWIADNYIKANDLKELNTAGEKEVNKQWNHLVKSLTNDLKKNVYGGIEWKRIHNLPDHVYFNHAQHVTVGELECQTCHGKVEEMEVVEQHAPLSMGWCVNCHRQTGIQFSDNEYYESYQKYHEEIKDGKREKVTVAEIGGLECAKCHY